MTNRSLPRHLLFLGIFIITLLISTPAIAQTTLFNYQGSLKEGASPAEGNYQMKVALYDALNGGNQIGTTISDIPVDVSQGSFSMKLDFGVSVFTGADRFLEISIRHNSGESYVTLGPREQIASSPYSIRTKSAQQADLALDSDKLGGLGAGQYVQTDDIRLSDARNPIAGSSNYIQNSTVLQASTNFNISGNGTAAGGFSAPVLNAVTEFDLNGVRVLSSPGTSNLFAGVNAGASNGGGSFNSFYGENAGKANTTGSDNAFFGRSAGFSNSTGGANTFVGTSAGFSNSSGDSNSFFGTQAGRDTNSGIGNSLFGKAAGIVNTVGNFNAFFGANAGFKNTIGSENSFFGLQSGQENTTGEDNAFFGSDSGAGNTTGARNSFFGSSTGAGNTTGNNNTLVGNLSNVSSGNLSNATAIGAGVVVTASNRVQIGRVAVDTVAIGAFASPSSSTAVCINANGVFTSCSSSLRYKHNIESFYGGLDLLKQLRPVTFNWNEGNTADVGLVAEEVAEVIPILSFRNEKSKIEGVKYAQLTVLLINAVKEQQGEIERQRETVRRQDEEVRQLRLEFAALKLLVCERIREAQICN